MKSVLAVVAGVAAMAAMAAPTVQAATIDELSKELTDLSEVLSKSVVTVTSEPRLVVKPSIPGVPMPEVSGRRTTASGVVYDGAGHVVTIATSLRRNAKVTVTLASGKALPATVVGQDLASNLAVLRVEGAGLTPARWGASRDVKPGALVLAVGSSFGMGPSVTLGVVSAVGRSAGGHPDLIQITAPVNPGDSGGLLASSRGEVVGIVTATLGRSPSGEWLDRFLQEFEPRLRSDAGPRGSVIPMGLGEMAEPADEGLMALAPWVTLERGTHVGSQGMNFALPSDAVKLVVDQLIKTGKVPRGYLGVMIEERAGSTPGCTVAQVAPNSPAAKAGLQVGDRLLAVGGVRVNTFAELSRTVSRQPPGARVDVLLKRDGKEMTVSATLSDPPTGEAEGPVRRVPSPSAAPAPAERRPLIGILTQPLSPDLAEFFGLKDGGVLVSGVLPGSPAEKAGLKTGDCITQVDGKAVADNDDLRAAIERNAGQTVVFDVLREKKAMQVKVAVPAGAGASEDRIRQLDEQIRKLQEELKALREKG
jgi:serine protease Do